MCTLLLYETPFLALVINISVKVMHFLVLSSCFKPVKERFKIHTDEDPTEVKICSGA